MSGIQMARRSALARVGALVAITRSRKFLLSRVKESSDAGVTGTPAGAFNSESNGSPLVQREFIFSSAPFASCHASTIAELLPGGFMAAWFGGSAEGKPDVAIWGSRRTSDGWSAPMELAREPQIACYNPVLFHTQSGRLWLYYKFGPHATSWAAGRQWSSDKGATWSAVEHLPAASTVRFGPSPW